MIDRQQRNAFRRALIDGVGSSAWNDARLQYADFLQEHGHGELDRLTEAACRCDWVIKTARLYVYGVISNPDVRLLGCGNMSEFLGHAPCSLVLVGVSPETGVFRRLDRGRAASRTRALEAFTKLDVAVCKNGFFGLWDRAASVVTAPDGAPSCPICENEGSIDYTRGLSMPCRYCGRRGIVPEWLLKHLAFMAERRNGLPEVAPTH